MWQLSLWQGYFAETTLNWVYGFSAWCLKLGAHELKRAWRMERAKQSRNAPRDISKNKGEGSTVLIDHLLKAKNV
jgi:hypothetical protein